ncbi:hypothetical protein JW935_15435 [candidate division KSB1 bacterium]|nr:hypothetical protein [candidate division KSB1 bacterium]
MLFLATCIYAGDTRVQTMGGETGLLPEDDSNIGLFPQRVNDWNILRIQDIASDYYDFLLTTGSKGDKWAFYGSVSNEDYLLNIVKSLSETSAIDLGLLVSTASATFTEKTGSTDDSEMTASNSTLGLELTYGTDIGDKEVAVTGFFASGPNAEEAVPENPIVSSPFHYGKIEYKTGGQETSSAKAGDTIFGVGAAIRAPMDFFIFDKMYGDAYLYNWSGTSEKTEAGSTTADDAESEFYARAEMWLFKNKQIIPEGDVIRGARLVYGVGGRFVVSSESSEDKQSSVKNEDTAGEFAVGGPSLRIGLEADVKFAQVRFGVQRDFTLFGSASAKQVYGESEQEVTASGIGQNGNLYINSGLGFTLGNLKIDVMLNKAFWENGPQMIFNDTQGDLTLMTDVTYSFPIK